MRVLTRTQFVIARSKATRQSRWLAGNSSFGEIAASVSGGLAMTVLTKVDMREERSLTRSHFAATLRPQPLVPIPPHVPHVEN